MKSSPNRQRRQIALVIETSNAYGRGLLAGISRRMRELGTWSATLIEAGRGDGGAGHLAAWSGDGILARIENADVAAAVQATGLPAVDLSAARLLPALPWVETDDRAIAAQAVAHLRERGFRQLGFVGDARFAWSANRARHAAELLRADGLDCITCNLRPGQAVPAQREAIAAWLRSCAFPLGVFCAYDPLGHLVLDVARGLRLHVPEELAVVGVDDDAVLCGLADPPLSSVRPDAEGAGHAATGLLERLLAGEAVPPQAVLFRPLGLAARASTDGIAVDDPQLRAALALAQARACDGIGIPGLVRASGLSRQVLDRRCRRLLGRTIKEELDRIRLRRVRELLLGTDLPVSGIARLAGFDHPEYLGVVWRRHLGVSPAAWRRSQQEATARH